DSVYEADLEAAKLLNGMKLVVDDIRMESWEKASYQGKLVIGEGEIGFHAVIEPTQFSILVDGMNVPIVLVLQEATDSASIKPFMESFVSLIYKHAPNPKNIDISWVNET